MTEHLRVGRRAAPTIGQNGAMTTSGSRSGSRRGPRRARSRGPALLGLALGVTLAVVAWGYLVLAAIDFGTDARSGDTDAWWLLGLAALGAMACLFLALMLVARLLARLGVGAAPPAAETERAASPRTPGGRRAAR